MEDRTLLDFLAQAEKLKCNTRHCYTSSGRKESVAEHSWRLGLMAMLLSGEAEFQDADMLFDNYNRIGDLCHFVAKLINKEKDDSKESL